VPFAAPEAPGLQGFSLRVIHAGDALPQNAVEPVVSRSILDVPQGGLLLPVEWTAAGDAVLCLVHQPDGLVELVVAHTNRILYALGTPEGRRLYTIELPTGRRADLGRPVPILERSSVSAHPDGDAIGYATGQASWEVRVIRALLR
jgi:hypothetical protein